MAFKVENVTVEVPGQGIGPHYDPKKIEFSVSGDGNLNGSSYDAQNDVLTIDYAFFDSFDNDTRFDFWVRSPGGSDTFIENDVSDMFFREGNSITLTGTDLSGSDAELEIAVDESDISHNNLANIGPSDHHTKPTAGTGLNGTNTFNVNDPLELSELRVTDHIDVGEIRSRNASEIAFLDSGQTGVKIAGMNDIEYYFGSKITKDGDNFKFQDQSGNSIGINNLNTIDGADGLQITGVFEITSFQNNQITLPLNLSGPDQIKSTTGPQLEATGSSEWQMNDLNVNNVDLFGIKRFGRMTGGRIKVPEKIPSDPIRAENENGNLTSFTAAPIYSEGGLSAGSASIPSGNTFYVAGSGTVTSDFAIGGTFDVTGTGTHAIDGTLSTSNIVDMPGVPIGAAEIDETGSLDSSQGVVTGASGSGGEYVLNTNGGSYIIVSVNDFTNQGNSFWVAHWSSSGGGDFDIETREVFHNSAGDDVTDVVIDAPLSISVLVY